MKSKLRWFLEDSRVGTALQLPFAILAVPVERCMSPEGASWKQAWDRNMGCWGRVVFKGGKQ